MKKNISLSLNHIISNHETDKNKSKKWKEIQHMSDDGKCFHKKKAKEMEKKRHVSESLLILQ